MLVFLRIALGACGRAGDLFQAHQAAVFDVIFLDLPLGVDMLYRTRNKYPWLDMQTLYPFTEDGVNRAVADAMAMKTVKSTIIPWPELVE